MTDIEKVEAVDVKDPTDGLDDLFDYFSIPPDAEEGNQDFPFKDDAAMVEFKENRKQLLKEAVERLKVKKETK